MLQAKPGAPFKLRLSWTNTRFRSDKAHSRSLRKGQGYSNYTLQVKQSFIIIVHIILNLKVVQ